MSRAHTSFERNGSLEKTIDGASHHNHPVSKLSNVRVDSPRFVEACYELGIPPASFHPKSLEDFAVPGVAEDIQKMRYEHYINRINQTLQEVLQKRKEIRVRQKNLNVTANNISGEPSKIMNSSLAPRDIISDYSKTVTYIKNSHKGCYVKAPEELNLSGSDLSPDRDYLAGGHSMFSDPIQKYNKFKKVAQCEAASIFEVERKMFELAERQREREMRLNLLEEGKKAGHLAFGKEQKRKTEEKKRRLEEISLEEENKRKILARELREREQKHLQNAAAEKELKAKQAVEQMVKENQKKDEALARREQFVKKVEEEIDHNYDILNDRLNDRSKKRDVLQEEKIRKMKAESEKALAKLVRYKEDVELAQEDRLNKLSEKIMKRNETFQSWMTKMQRDEAEKRATQQEKANRFFKAQKEIRIADNSRKKGLEEKSRKAEEYIKNKKEQEDHEFLRRQEYRRLKEEDKLENYERERRQHEYRLTKMKEKEARIADKIKAAKNQQELLYRARMEAAVHAKIEKERIMMGMTTVTTTLFNQPHRENEKTVSPSQKVLNQSLKMLQTLVPPERMSTQIQTLRDSFDVKPNKKKNQLSVTDLKSQSSILK